MAGAFFLGRDHGSCDVTVNTLQEVRNSGVLWIVGDECSYMSHALFDLVCIDVGEDLGQNPAIQQAYLAKLETSIVQLDDVGWNFAVSRSCLQSYCHR
jgi:hypothetical protein